MSDSTTYLDNAATTKPLPEVIARMNEVLTDAFGNPSSVHAEGRRAKLILDQSRHVLARALGVHDDEVYFTSGATESNNLAIRGACMARQDSQGQIITSALEHAAVTRSVRGLRREGWKVSYIEAVAGELNLHALRETLAQPTTLITIMRVQNETGYLFPIEKVVRLRNQFSARTLVHCDAVQAFGKLPVNPHAWGVDLLSIASHKIGGPRGVGALFVKRGTKMFTTAFGGGQEHGLRSGTEPVFLIAGFAEAARLALQRQEHSFANATKLKHRTIHALQERLPGLVVNSRDDGSPFILSISVPGLPNKVSVPYLSDHGVYISRASACESNHEAIAEGTWRKKHPLSLQAAGVPLELGACTLRISFSGENTIKDVDRLVETLSECARQMAVSTSPEREITS